MTHAEMGLLAVVIALLGLGGGRLWSNRKLNAIQQECKECKEGRVEKEHELDKEIGQVKLDISAALETLKQGQLEVKELVEKLAENSDKLLVISTWLEKNGIIPPMK